MTEDSKPHSGSEHTTHFHDAADRARELLAFEGEPKVIGQWFAEARYMARAYLGLVEQLEVSRLGERAWGELMNWAWTIICNVSEGDWTKQQQEWQEAAAKCREQYHALLASNPASEPGAPDE